MRKPYNELPLEDVLRLLIKERDRYKQKLGKVVHYAHLMEDKVARIQKENEALKKGYQVMEAQYNEVVNKGVTKSPQYKKLQEQYSKLKRDKETLITTIITLRNNESR